MSDEILIIKKQIKDMAAIFNAVPDEKIDMPCIMPLLIMQRRMEDSTLKSELTVFTDICSKEDVLSADDIVKASVALVRLQTLVEAKREEHDAFSIRELIKRLKSSKTKAENLIHLSKVNALTADDFQKVQIEKTLSKNEKLLLALEDEIKKVEREIERNPLPEKTEEKAPKTKEPKKKERAPDSKIDKALEKIKSLISDRFWHRDHEDELKDIEREKSKTKLKEVPFYDAKLIYTEKAICKDIPEFSILNRKNNVYFGKTDNIRPGFYDNSDESLIELTFATDEFLQYMEQDILSGDYLITEFSDDEKEGLILYLDFLSFCFTEHIGKELSVREYLSFKSYYNRIVRLMFSAERQEREDYYRAYEIADIYSCYMKIYDLGFDDRDTIIENILSDKGDAYIEDLDLIMENHIVDNDARDDIEELKDRISHFHPDTKVILEDDPGDNETDEEADAETKSMPDCQFIVQILDEDGALIDEAVYAGSNMKQAMADFDKRDGAIKRLGVRKDGNDIFYDEKRRM